MGSPRGYSLYSMKHLPRTIGLLTIAIASLASCAARYDAVLREDGSARITVSARLATSALRLAENLAAFSSGPSRASNASPIDAASIGSSLRGAPSVSAVTMSNGVDGALSGSFTVQSLEALLADRLPGTNPIVFRSSASGGSLSLRLDKESVPELLLLASPELNDWLTALFAPIATGESLSKEEHRSLLAAFYSEQLADDLYASKVTLTLTLPGPVASISGGTAKGSDATFVLSMGDLLLMESPIQLSCSWSK